MSGAHNFKNRTLTIECEGPEYHWENLKANGDVTAMKSQSSLNVVKIDKKM